MVKLGQGCGPGKLGDLIVPDYPFGQCCKKHDLEYDKIVNKMEAYYHGNFINFVTNDNPQKVYNRVLNVIQLQIVEYKRRADLAFLDNMLLTASGMSKWVGWWYRRKAKIYYKAVSNDNGQISNYVYRLFLKRLGGIA